MSEEVNWTKPADLAQFAEMDDLLLAFSARVNRDSQPAFWDAVAGLAKQYAKDWRELLSEEVA